VLLPTLLHDVRTCLFLTISHFDSYCFPLSGRGAHPEHPDQARRRGECYFPLDIYLFLFFVSLPCSTRRMLTDMSLFIFTIYNCYLSTHIPYVFRVGEREPFLGQELSLQAPGRGSHRTHRLNTQHVCVELKVEMCELNSELVCVNYTGATSVVLLEMLRSLLFSVFRVEHRSV